LPIAPPLFARPTLEQHAGDANDALPGRAEAVVVRKSDVDFDAGALIDWARESIAGYKLPRSVDFVDALPRNPTGKILKRELRKPYWGDRQRQVN
jgi:acyl-CoA synthetase (AMP-forming)/AMP-acid ligase II